MVDSIFRSGNVGKEKLFVSTEVSPVEWHRCRLCTTQLFKNGNSQKITIRNLESRYIHISVNFEPFTDLKQRGSLLYETRKQKEVHIVY